MCLGGGFRVLGSCAGRRGAGCQVVGDRSLHSGFNRLINLAKPWAMKLERVIIYPQDIQRITGRSERYAQRMLRVIKKRLGKKKHQLVTFEEFCEFSGLSVDELEKYAK